MNDDDLEQTHHNLVNEVTGDEALKNSPYLPSGLPQGQSPEWHVNNPKESPLRHFRGDASIKEYAKSAGDYYEQQMKAAGAGDDVIGAARPQVEAAAAGKARQHALSQLENLGRQKEWAHWVEQALPFASGIRQANREKDYQYAEDAFGKGQAGIGDYLTMGEKIGRMKQANDETWYEKMGHIAAGGLAFAGEIAMTGGLGASAGAAGAAKLGGGKVAQLAAAGLGTTALRPTAAVEEYVRRGDKAPVMGEDGQPLVDAKGNFQFAEPDSEGARLYKTALSQYIDNTIMPNLAGAFSRGTGSYAQRVMKKTLAALAAGEASEDLKYYASLAPEASDAHQLVFGGPKGRMEALKNLAIKTGGFGIMEAGTQGFHMMDEASVRKLHESKIAEVARQDGLEAAKNPPAPHDHPLSPAEQLRQEAEGMRREAEENPALAEVRAAEGRVGRAEGVRRGDIEKTLGLDLSDMPSFAGDEPEALPGRRGVGGRDIEGELGRFDFRGMPEHAGEIKATVPPERTVANARVADESAGRVSDGGGGGGGDRGAGQPPLGQRVPGQDGGGLHPEVKKIISNAPGLTPEEARQAHNATAKQRGLKPLESTKAEPLDPARVQGIVDRNAKQIAKEGVPPDKISDWLQKKGTRKDLADAAQANWNPKRAYKTPSPTVAKEIAKDQARTDSQILDATKGTESGTLSDIRDKINGQRQKKGLKPLTEEQVDDSLMRHMDAGKISRHRLSDGSFVYAHNESFEGMKAEAKAEGPERRASVATPQELKDDIERFAAGGRGAGSEASLRRDAEVHLQKGIQDGIAHADERAGAPAQGDAGRAPAAAVPEAPGNVVSEPDLGGSSLSREDIDLNMGDARHTREGLWNRFNAVKSNINDGLRRILNEASAGFKVHESPAKLTKDHYDRHGQPVPPGVNIRGLARQFEDGTTEYHLTNQSSAWTAAHELGHGVYNRLIRFDPEKAAAWDAIFQKELADKQLSSYASSKPTEGFAELFALTHDGGFTDDVEERFPEAAQFLKDEGMWPKTERRLPGSVELTREAIDTDRGVKQRVQKLTDAKQETEGLIQKARRYLDNLLGSGGRGAEEHLDIAGEAQGEAGGGPEGREEEARAEAGPAGTAGTADRAIRQASVSRATESAVDDFFTNESGSVDLDALKEKLGKGINYVRNGLLKFGGDSFPSTHQADREAGQKVTEMSVARDHGQRLGQYHRDYVLGKDSTPEQRQLVGGVADEMRLRYARQNLLDEIIKASGRDPDRVNELRKQLDGMHDTLIGTEDFPLKSEQEYQDGLNNPFVKQAFDKYRGDTAKELDKNYAAYLGIDADEIDTLTQIPGMPLNFLRATDKGSPKGDFSNLNNLRQKGNPFAREARLSGKYNYDFGDMIDNSFQRGEVAAKQAVANNKLIEEGLASPAARHETKEGYTFVPDVHYRIPKSEIEDNRENMTAKEFRDWTNEQKKKDGLLVRNDVHDEYLRAKAVETPAGWKKVSKAINQIPLLGALSTSVEGLAHLKNQLIANFAPGMSVVDTWKNAVEAFKGSDQFKREMLELSNIGAAKPPGEHKGVLEQLPLVGQALEKAKQATGHSLDPTYYMGEFIKRTDEIMRVSLAHAYDSAVPEEKQTQQGKTDFINHWQFNYNKKAMPQILALAKESGIGPFAVASAQGKLRNISTLFGGHGVQGLSWGEDALMRAQVYRNILTPVIAAAAVNYFTTGRMDGGEDAPPLSIYVGTDDQGKKKYLDIGTLTGISPALRSLGLMAQIEGARKGETSGDRIDKSTMDIVHGLADPILGPGPRAAWTAVTGKDTYGKQVAGLAGYGESQAKKNLGAALLHTNPTAASLAEGGKSAGEQVAGALGPFGFKYNEGKSPAVGQFKEALKKTSDVFNEARLKARDQGLKVQEPPELKALNRYSEAINKYELAFHQKGLTDEARQRLRAAQAKVAQTALQYFERVRSSR